MPGLKLISPQHFTAGLLSPLTLHQSPAASFLSETVTPMIYLVAKKKQLRRVLSLVRLKSKKLRR